MKKLRVKMATLGFWIGIGFVILRGMNSPSLPTPLSQNDKHSPTGHFRTVTYNVAGLPEWISRSRPSENMPLIAKKISDYALALVQEDFWYDRELSEHADFPYKNEPVSSTTVGDGLGQFSKWPLGPTKHVSWEDCHGFVSAYNDCLTAKGFSFSSLELMPGVEAHVYNLHLDAGESTGDREARASQLRQLTAFMKAHSEGYPLIVAGDFNFHLESKDSADLLPYLRFLKESGLTDACYATQCPEERLDRILYRSNAKVLLSAMAWSVENDFKDSQGEPLSDHEPVAVDFNYQINLGPEDMEPALASVNPETLPSPRP